MINHYLHIAGLIARYLSGEITPDEHLELKNWRESAPEHEALFKRVSDTRNLADYMEEVRKFDKQDGWTMLSRRMKAARRRAILLRWSRYAAIFLLPVVLTIWIYSNQKTAQQSVAQQVREQPAKILPGERKAILTLADGEIVDLKGADDKVMEEKDGTAINIDSMALNYQSLAKDKKSMEEIFNKVEIPRGGEYSLQLSDGTRIYLNSMSSLRFPVCFVGERRVVELEGEAYFNVVKSSKPFIVKVNQMEIEVLGTDFNISAYQGEDCQATLVNGSVKVHTATGSSCILQPSEQAYLKPGSEDLRVRKVDTSLYTSWVEGKIHFKDERLEDIINSLSRWYDMNVFYSEPSVKNIRFGCNVNRYKEITPFLELLEKTEKVSISIQGKNITFKHHHH